jgi:hypothetical protein
MRLTICLVTSVLCLVFKGYAQDSLQVDTNTYHAPKRAVLYSAILPCAGQFYNHFAFDQKAKGKNNIYWKVPLYYGALGATSYFLIQNQATLNSVKTEYTNRQNPDFPIEQLNPVWGFYSDDALLSEHDQVLKQRDFSLLGIFLVYAFQIVDAGIEAHFVQFDISEDLSFKFSPTILPNNQIGAGFTLNFR